MRGRSIFALVVRVASWLAMGLLAPASAQSAGLGIDWRVPMIAPSSSAPIGVAGRLFIIDDAVSAISGADGVRLWRAPLGEYAPRCLQRLDDLVIAAADQVIALDAVSGEERWRYRPSAHTALACGAVRNSRFITGTAEGEVIALAPDGTLLWSQRIGDQDAARPAVVRGVTIDGGTAYIAAEQWRTSNGSESTGWILAIEAASGRILWGTLFGMGGRHNAAAAPAIVPEAELVVVPDALGNSVIAVDRRNGRRRWEFKGEKDAMGFTATPLVIGGAVVAGSGDAHVYALDIATGEPIWRAALPASVGAVALCGERLIAVYQGLAVIDPRDGRVLARMLDEENDFISSGLFVSDDRLAAAGPKSLYRLDCRSASSAPQ